MHLAVDGGISVPIRQKVSVAFAGVGPAVAIRESVPKTTIGFSDLLSYETLGLEDIHLGYPGRFREDSPVHAALGRLTPGDTLAMRALEGNGIGIFDKAGVCVARLSRKGDSDWGERVGTVRRSECWPWPLELPPRTLNKLAGNNTRCRSGRFQ